MEYFYKKFLQKFYVQIKIDNRGSQFIFSLTIPIPVDYYSHIDNKIVLILFDNNRFF